MFEILLKTLEAGLSLWADKEKNKYIDQLISLRGEYYAESNKDPSDRSDARLDNIEFQLRLVAIGFASSVGKQNSETLSGKATTGIPVV